MNTCRPLLVCVLASLCAFSFGAQAQVVTEFSAGITGGAHPRGITVGPDGNLWFAEAGTDRIGQITPSGTVTEFSSGVSAGSHPVGITAGPDGNLWFTEQNGLRIGRITTAGVVTEFTVGISGITTDITAGPDGNLWFTESSRQPDRADHDRRRRHRIHAGISAGAVARRHRGRSGWQPLVYRKQPAIASGRSPRAASSPSSAPASPRTVGLSVHRRRPRRQSLVHRTESPPDWPDYPRWESLPSSVPAPTARHPVRRDHSRTRTATSGSPNLISPAISIGRISPSRRRHRVHRGDPQRRCSVLSGSRPARTATSGSPKASATRSLV